MGTSTKALHAVLVQCLLDSGFCRVCVRMIVYSLILFFSFLYRYSIVNLECIEIT